MKEKSRARKASMLSSPTQDELFVAQILLDLPSLISIPESRPALKWGFTRKRSRFNHSSISASSPKNDVKIEERLPHPKAAAESGGAATSPVTPLAFSPSESDRKSRKRTSHKRSREKYTAMIKELTQRRDSLTEEIGNVTNYYNKLVAYNSELKAMKQEVLNSCQIKEETKVEISRYGNVGVELRQQHHGIILGQPQPLVSDQMADKIHSAQFDNGPAQFDSGLGVGPFGIPDLNISAEECSISCQRDLFTDRRFRCAEARRRRKDIIKIKVMKNVCGGSNKFPRTR